MRFMQFIIIISAVLAVFTIIPSTSAAQTWKKADLTTFESYPTSDEECNEYNGCEFQGQFAFVEGKKSLGWVKKHNIISIHSKFSKTYKLKNFAIRQGTKSINATVYDECIDSDCKGCCTKNMKKSGFLIDMESFTFKRFKGSGGVVEWMCLNC